MYHKNVFGGMLDLFFFKVMLGLLQTSMTTMTTPSDDVITDVIPNPMTTTSTSTSTYMPTNNLTSPSMYHKDMFGGMLDLFSMTTSDDVVPDDDDDDDGLI